MDTIEECARDAAIELFGLTEEAFFQWLKFTGKSDLPDWFLHTCIVMNDRKILNPLKEKFWDEFVEEIGLAGKASRDKNRMLWS